MKIITDKDKIKESFEETYHHHPTFLFYNKKQYPTEKHFKITCEFSFYSEDESKKTIEFLKLHCPKLHILEADEAFNW